MKLFHNTPHAPKEYWCYGALFLDTVRCCLAKSSINDQKAFEARYGSTCDISIFCFPWFCLVWYYDPTTAFPEDKTSPGFFLDIAENTGDTFSYVILPGSSFDDILTKGRIYPFVWNIVQKCAIDDDDAPIVNRSMDALSFYNSKGEELVGDNELRIINNFDDCYHDNIDVSQQNIDSLTSELDAEDTSNVQYRDSPSFGDSLLSPIPEDEVLEETVEELEEPSAPEEAPLATEEHPSKQQRTLFPSPGIPMVSEDDNIDSNEEMKQPPSPQN